MVDYTASGASTNKLLSAYPGAKLADTLVTGDQYGPAEALLDGDCDGILAPKPDYDDWKMQTEYCDLQVGPRDDACI